MMALDQMLALVQSTQESPDEKVNIVVSPSFDVEPTSADASSEKDFGASGLLDTNLLPEFADKRQINNTFPDRRDYKTWQKVEFAKLVRKYKYVLFGDCDGLMITAKTKEEAWRRISIELEEMGADSYKGKTWMRLRDHDWQYIRRHAVSRYENGNVKQSRLSELDEIVIDIVQPEKHGNNNNSNGLRNDTLGAQLCSLLAATHTDATVKSVSSTAITAQEELVHPIREANASTASASTASSPSSFGTQCNLPSTSAAKRSCIDSGLRASLASLSSLGFASAPQSVDYVAPKRQKIYENGFGESASDTLLERQKIELEIEHMINEEERRRELHQLEVERARLVVQCLQVRLFKECSDKADPTDLVEFLKGLQ